MHGSTQGNMQLHCMLLAEEAVHRWPYPGLLHAQQTLLLRQDTPLSLQGY